MTKTNITGPDDEINSYASASTYCIRLSMNNTLSETMELEILPWAAPNSGFNVNKFGVHCSARSWKKRGRTMCRVQFHPECMGSGKNL